MVLVLGGLVLIMIAAAPASAQDTAAQDTAHRMAVLRRLPPGAAQRAFGLARTPAAGPAQAIGSYARGCLEGAAQLPPDGPYWEVMRPSRNRAWGHPALIAVIERLATALPAEGWSGLLVGDIAQPRGGPMLTGHASHQIGLDADVWLTPMPAQRLSPVERDTMPATDLVAPDGLTVAPDRWTPRYRRLLETAAREPQVARIFVNAAIKRKLCTVAGADRGWLRKIRPWWGHKTHFHMRILCPPGDALCRNQAPPPKGDGCGRQLDWWFTRQALHPKPGPPRKPLMISDLPAPCAALVHAR